MMEDLNEYLAKIYEHIRYQQQIIFDLRMKIRSLEMALDTNQSFAELRKQTALAALVPADVKEHAALIAVFDLEIARLRGSSTPVADA